MLKGNKFYVHQWIRWCGIKWWSLYYDLWCWSCKGFYRTYTMRGRNHGLFIFFNLHVIKAYMCVVCMLSCSYKCYLGDLKTFYVFCVLRRFFCREGGDLGSRNIGKIWLVSLVLLDLSGNRKIHKILVFSSKNQVIILQFLESSVIACWTICQEWRPMAVLLKSFQLCQGCKSVPPFQGEKLK